MEITQLFAKYRSKGILVDTNLLLVLVVGICDKARIATFKRTKGYSEEDFELLVKVLRTFPLITTTPNILTEVSNFLGQLPEDVKPKHFNLFAAQISRLVEQFYESSIISRNSDFWKFGITDCGVIEHARDSYLVLTDDLKLCNYLQHKGIDAVNFTHLRFFNWFSP